MKKNLFIVASPVQLLNALEAKSKFKISNNTLVFIYNKPINFKEKTQQEELLHQKDWDEIIYYNKAIILKKNRFLEQVKLIKSLLKFEYDYIFSGEFGTIHHIMLANLRSNYMYLIDDGNATIFTYNKLKDSKYFSQIKLSRKIRLYRYILVGLNYKIKQNINFFTTFNIQPLKHIGVVQHSFEHLKSNKLQNIKLSNDIYLLGQNLAEVNFMNKNIYLQYLQKIKNNYLGNIIYVPHRSELVDEDYDFLKDTSFTIVKSKGPIEVTFLSDGIYPKTIISFISSSLFNLDKIFMNSEIHAIKIKDNDLLSNKEMIQDCYNFFENTGVQIIHLD